MTVPELSGVGRFNPSNIDKLVENVEAQGAGTAAYDLDLNLAVLKLYQFNPTLVNVDVITRILLKALTQLPNADFNLCMGLLNEQLSENAEVLKIVTANELLQTAKFADFWKHAATITEQTSKVHGFADTVRKFIALTVGITFQKIALAVLGGYVNLQGDELTKFVTSLGWSVSGDSVAVALIDENQAKASTVQDLIKISQLTRIIGYATSI